MKWVRITSLAAKGAVANRLQCRTNCKTQNGHQGSGKGCTPRFLGILNNFCQISFLIRELFLWKTFFVSEASKLTTGAGIFRGP